MRKLLFALLFAASWVVPLAAEKPDVRARLIAPERLAAGSKGTIAVEMTIGAKWHVNSHTPSESYLIPTEVTLTASAGALSSVRYPRDVEKRFSFSDKPLRVYAGTVRFEADLDLPAGAGGSVSIAGSVSYQACDDKQCFAPAKIPLEATLAIRGATASPTGDDVTLAEVTRGASDSPEPITNAPERELAVKCQAGQMWQPGC